MIRSFTVDAGTLEAEIAGISEGPAADASDLVRSAVKRLESHAAAGALPLPDAQWLSFEPARDPGRVADVIASCLKMPMIDKYELLATLDPIARLQNRRAARPVGAPASPLSSRRRSSARPGEALQRRHQYTTLEHLLLALIDDPHASAVM